MLEISLLRENPDKVIERLAKKYFDAKDIVSRILDLDIRRRETQRQLEENLAQANNLAKEIGNLFKQGELAKAEVLKKQTVELKAQAKELDEKLEVLQKDQNELLILLPNMPHETTPEGRLPENNPVVFEKGEIPVLASDAVAHWDLTQKYDIIDFELGVKLTGAGFPVYKGKGAKLQRALINFFLDNATQAGYVEVQPPLMVNEASGYGTGQLPDKDSQMYHVGLDGFYLIPTAEVPVTNIYRNVILKENDFPIKNVAYSQCFRREAGSYGKDVRGLNRLHQFDKVEIVQIAHPERSYEILEQMRAHVAHLLDQLELPYRIIRLCGGDMSFTSAWTYDFEVYSAAQQRWLEVSSVSNFENFQANRMKCRFKDADGKTRLVHTLNGSALALPRIVAALLENNQTPEGIKIPKALIPYTGFDLIS